MKEVWFFISKNAKKLSWIPSVIVALLPLYFVHLEREWRFFRKSTLSYKRFIEAVYSNPEGVFGNLPAPLKTIPFGEKTGLVLGKKTINIREVSNPYNASLIKKQDSDEYHLFFRYDFLDENVRGGLTAYIGCAELNANFDQTEKDFIAIDTHSKHSEDPRAVRMDNKLFLVYNDLVEEQLADNRMMYMGEVDLAHAKLKAPVRFDPRFQAIEKNWVPFVYKDAQDQTDLYFEYSIVPLKVLKVTSRETEPLVYLPSTLRNSLQDLYWPKMWGGIRGGTPAQKVGKEYLAFFHSSFRDKEVQWYCIGAYTFEAEPPFRITGISSFPILFEGIYSTPPMNTADPNKRVIFPGGFVVEERDGREVIQLSCGENDSAIKIITLDKKVLLQGLKQVRLKNYK